MHNVYVLLGGNTGNVPDTFSQVLETFAEKGFVTKSKSSLYFSEPWGMESSRMFCNQAVLISTSLPAAELLRLLLDIELSLGRKRTRGVTGDRTIDIDILFYDDQVIEMPGLVVPHPRMHLRNFALIPMLEIAPGKKHPFFGKTIKQLCRESVDKKKVYRKGEQNGVTSVP